MSHAVGEHLTGGVPIIESATGNYLKANTRMGGVDIGCLIDTGDEVPIITESFCGIVCDLVEQTNSHTTECKHIIEKK